MKMKAIVIEDEINVREGFLKLINAFCPEIQVINTAENVEDGIQLVNNTDFDLLFLDIHLPDGSGFDLMHQVTNKNFQLIFVTAYDKYAIDAFKLSAVDYLLKPVSPDLLQKAILKVKTNPKEVKREEQLKILDNHFQKKEQSNKIILKDQESIHLVKISDILYCKAEGSYTTFCIIDGRNILTSMNLKEYDQLLNPYQFIRCHHSFLVNIHEIREVRKADGGYLNMSDGSLIPISTRKKAQILEEINRVFLS
jgi:two-component system LytT family response regulator